MAPQTSGIEFYERDESGRITTTATYIPGRGKDELRVIVSFRLFFSYPSRPPPLIPHSPRGGGARDEEDKDYDNDDDDDSMISWMKG